jgi:hypothetical protein
MQFTSALAVAALAGSAAAYYPTYNSSSSVVVDYVTDVVTSYTTYCPEATVLTYNSVTYTITEATTLTVTNCPCTIVKPVTYSSAVTVPTSAPVYPASNATATTYAVGTTSAKATVTPTPSTITTSGANNLVALSGASLAGLLAVAAYIL